MKRRPTIQATRTAHNRVVLKTRIDPRVDEHAAVLALHAAVCEAIAVGRAVDVVVTLEEVG